MDNQGWSSSEWYNVIQNWKNQKSFISSNTNTSTTGSNVNLSISGTTGDNDRSFGRSNSSLSMSGLGNDDDVSASIDSFKSTRYSSGGGGINTSGSGGGTSNITSSLSGSSNNNTSGNSSIEPPHVVVETLVKSLKTVSDDILRCNLLIFLQENSSLLFSLEEDPKRFERVFTILQSMINSQTDSYPLKCQVLSTMASILICESIIKTNPKLVESFIDLLLDIISKVNNSPDRLLRGSACLCLIEFELTYPCILSSYTPLFTQYCQAENSHLIQSYTNLLSTTLQNTTLNLYEDATVTYLKSNQNITSPTQSIPVQQQQPQQQQQQSSYSSSRNISSPQNSLNYGVRQLTKQTSTINIFEQSGSGEGGATVAPYSIFSIPPNIKYIPISLPKLNQMVLSNQGNVRLSESTEREVFKCASAIADQSAYLNSWGLLTIIHQLTQLIDVVNIPHNFFRNHLHLLYKFFFTDHTTLFHIILYLNIKFPDLYSQDELDYCFKRIIYLINDTQLSLENRVLAMDWFLSLPEALNQKSINIYNQYPLFYPNCFDSILLKESKLYVLSKCLASSPNQSPPDDLLKSLNCLEEFKYHSEQSIVPRIVFSAILEYLTTFPILLFSKVEQFLSDILIQYPQFLNIIISLLNGLQQGNAFCKKTKINIFLSLSKIIVLLKPLDFLRYLPLVERTILENQIDPTPLLYKIYDLIRKKAICLNGNWYIGNIILSICRNTMIYHHIPTIAKPVKIILSFMSSYFCNLEIRDRSSFYHRLISHIPDDKIKALLNTQSLQNYESNVSGLVSTPIPSDKYKTITSVSNFLSISQLDKPVVNSFDIFEPNDVTKNSISSNDDHDIDYLNYISVIREPNRKLNATITIPFQIKYKRNISQSNTPLKVYALLIQLAQSSYYSHIHPIRIPYLCYPEANTNLILSNSNTNTSDPSYLLMEKINITSNNNQDEKEKSSLMDQQKFKEFPYSYDIDISFKPIYPIPVSFIVKTTFNDDEGKTCKTEGTSISIQFHDLFMKIPIPLNLKSSPNQFLSNLYHRLWNQNPKNNTMIESVKRISKTREQIQNALQNHKLTKFLIVEQEKEEQESTNENNVSKIIAFLPPQYHLLFKIEIDKDSAIVHIKTDYWRCLSLIDSYLSTIFK
ncbi:hypothetical protein CYY_009733 [Polysphondylium violaceum]|uniref:AP-5 complex subunit beta-1 n=1 Tax=Polysphondylium violaceum TaxID=133409 RepID=A0A8J4PME2_9MYCE|nr:hypothetical protein CYY_009733 [Polysphondylium violaceum]